MYVCIAPHHATRAQHTHTHTHDTVEEKLTYIHTTRAVPCHRKRVKSWRTCLSPVFLFSLLLSSLFSHSPLTHFSLLTSTTNITLSPSRTVSQEKSEELTHSHKHTHFTLFSLPPLTGKEWRVERPAGEGRSNGKTSISCLTAHQRTRLWKRAMVCQWVSGCEYVSVWVRLRVYDVLWVIRVIRVRLRERAMVCECVSGCECVSVCEWVCE